MSYQYVEWVFGSFYISYRSCYRPYQSIGCSKLATTTKQLKRFSWSVRVLQTFVKGYGQIAKPLTDLLKLNKFTWNSDANQDFNTLKNLLCTAPIEGLPKPKWKEVIFVVVDGISKAAHFLRWLIIIQPWM